MNDPLRKNNTSLQNKSLKDAFKDLFDRYVIVPINQTNDSLTLI